MKFMPLFSLTVIAGFAVFLAGCGKPSKEPAKSNPPSASDKKDKHDDGHDDGHKDGNDHADHGHGDHDHGDHAHNDKSGQSDMDKMKAELAKLSPADAASAKKQHICPVSDEMLGTMGAPLKVDVKGQQVWICCQGCKDDLLKSPDEFLAKLKK